MKSKLKVKPTKQLNRKELRKQKQVLKKKKKRIYFSGKSCSEKLDVLCQDMSKKQILNKPKGSAGYNDGSTKADNNNGIAISKKNSTTTVRTIFTCPDIVEIHHNEEKKKKTLENQAKAHRIRQLIIENEKEDKLIEKLEKKLKLNKSKDKMKLVRKMFSDGLDYALEFCLDEKVENENSIKEQKHKDGMKALVDSELSKDVNKNYNDMSDNDLSDNDKASANVIEVCPFSAEGKFAEDIYGRKRDKNGKIIPALSADADLPRKYFPPQQTGRDDQQFPSLERLKKNCKGLLNRLSETNLSKIAVAVEDLYMKNSRYDMNQTISDLFKEVLIQKKLSNERMIQEHVILLVYLHAQIGCEVGAHFLQTFIENFIVLIKAVDSIPVEDKTLNNLTLLLSYMYLFDIYEKRLLLDLIDALQQKLSEKSIECLLLIFQSVGFKLRKDDPLAFKQMILKIQRNISEMPTVMQDNSRLKYMIDILIALKNNNISKISHFDNEFSERLKKYLKSMLHNNKYAVTLNITLEDLAKANTVGKWWVIGSAWGGRSSVSVNKNENASNNSSSRYTEKILKLAKQQKMNTEERRNIFCIIMMSDDFIDAFQNILLLKLKDEGNIAYVIIHCVLQEKEINPYYSHLAISFCEYNRKFQLNFQFALWDRINELQSLRQKQVINLACFVKDLIVSHSLQLSVLKVVDFFQLNKLNYFFVNEIMTNVLLHYDDNKVYQVFERVAKNPNLKPFKQSIQLFMQHFLLKNENDVHLQFTAEKYNLLQKRIGYVCNLLAYVDL